MKAYEFLFELRSNPDKNKKYSSGAEELMHYAQVHSREFNYYNYSGVSMTRLPKLGINPGAGISEDSPRGIYYYPLWYYIQHVYGKMPLPWGDTYPYMHLFSYSAQENQILRDPNGMNLEKVKQSLSKFVPVDVIQECIETMCANTTYDLIHACLTRVYSHREEQKLVTTWNKILRDIGILVLEDKNGGWIAPGEPTQGCILDPRIISKVESFRNYSRKVPDETK